MHYLDTFLFERPVSPVFFFIFFFFKPYLTYNRTNFMETKQNEGRKNKLKKSMINYDRVREMEQERREEIKNLSAEMILNQEGVHVGRNKMIRCINPDHNDRKPSMHVYPNGVYCFSCHAHYNNVGIVMALNGCDYKEAEERIAENNSLPTIDEIKAVCTENTSVPYNHGDKGRKKQRFPKELTSDVIKRMGLQEFGSVVIGKRLTSTKPDGYGYFLNDPLADDYPYVEGDEIPYSLRDFFKEDPEAFWFMITGKSEEAYGKYAYLYNHEFWNWDIAPGPEYAVSLEQACWNILQELAPVYRKCHPRCRLVKRNPVWAKEE